MLTDRSFLEGGVCGIKINEINDSYYLKSFENENDLPETWHTTHFGKCGACSSIQDLKTYIDVKDMLKRARSCGKYLLKRRRIQCLKNIGLTSECANAWDNNIQSTRTHCLWPCIRAWVTNEPNVMRDGKTLNECLQCDEDISGPRFKKEAGRTRRNSGIVSSIQREDSEIRDVDHSKYIEISVATGS